MTQHVKVAVFGRSGVGKTTTVAKLCGTGEQQYFLKTLSFKRTCFHSNVIELDFESMHVSMQCVSLSWMLRLLVRRCFSLCKLTSGPPSNSWLSLNVNVLASDGM